MINTLLEKIRPIARSIKYGRLLRRAQSDASMQSNLIPNPPVSFILGCGRSGTTILGKLLATHTEVLYLFEPYHVWRAIQPATDMIQLYGEYDAHCVMGEEFVTNNEVKRFNACMLAELKRSRKKSPRLIEKTPINAMRISFLESISPSSPMLHLVRNGTDVVRSIERLSSTNTYQLSGKGDWNQWWGRDHCKWKALAKDAIANNYFPGEIELLKTNIEMGALEWLVSIGEIQARREVLGDQLLEVSYNELTKEPQRILKSICDHFDITTEQHWLDKCCNQLDKARKNQGEPIVLPPKMCETYNKYQEEYGFEGRAITR